MEVHAVIFDLYGVLAFNGWQTFKTKHLTDKPEVWNEVFELGRRVDAGQATTEELIAFTAEVTGESADSVRYQLEHTVANEQLLDYIARYLKPKYKLGILSNASNDIVRHLFTFHQQQLFDAITVSHEVGLTKPDPLMYETAANMLGVDASECLFVDDQERHVLGATEARMQTLLYKDFDQFTDDLEAMLHKMY
jgi:putative hydrolase of the HAD superfamily